MFPRKPQNTPFLLSTKLSEADRIRETFVIDDPLGQLRYLKTMSSSNIGIPQKQRKVSFMAGVVNEKRDSSPKVYWAKWKTLVE